MTKVWDTVPLIEVADIVTGATPPTGTSRYYGGRIPFVTPSELGSNEPITSAKQFLSEEGAAVVRIVPERSVMVSCIGTLGKIGIAGVPLVTNQQINAVVFNENRVIPRFGLHFLSTVRPLLESMAPATTIPIVNKSRFSQLSIPLPPLPEQRRIAAILDKADDLRTKRQQSVRTLDQLKDSLFASQFLSSRRAKAEWTTFEEITTRITYGFTNPMAHMNAGIPIVTAKNVRDGYLALEDAAFAKPEEFQALTDKSKPEPGDILVTKDGTIGRCAVVPKSTQICINQSVALLKPQRSRVVPEYVAAYIRSAKMQASLKGMGKGNALVHLQITELAKMPIPVPPLRDQQEYLDELGRLSACRSKLQASAMAVDTLFTSLQHRAFRGEL